MHLRIKVSFALKCRTYKYALYNIYTYILIYQFETKCIFILGKFSSLCYCIVKNLILYKLIIWIKKPKTILVVSFCMLCNKNDVTILHSV